MRAKLILAAVSVLLTLLAAEVAFRVVGIDCTGRGSPWFAGGNHPRFQFEPDPEASYALRPGFTGRQVAGSGEFEADVAIDPRGLREQPHPAPPGAPVVLALGDSMTFGDGVEADETYAARLEERTGMRVVNAGIPGYATEQMAVQFERLAPEVRPELVTVAFQPLWDRTRNARKFVYEEGFIVGPGYTEIVHLYGGNLVAEEVRWPGVGPATAWAKAHSSVACIALPGAKRVALTLAGRGGEKGPPLRPGDYAPTVGALEAIRDGARAIGAELLVVLIDARSPEEARERDVLEVELEAAGLDVLLLDDLVAEADWEALRYPIDTHWNAAGHERVAEVLAPEIERRLGEIRARQDPGSSSTDETSGDPGASPGPPAAGSR